MAPLPSIIEPASVLETIDFLKKLIDFFSAKVNHSDIDFYQV